MHQRRADDALPSPLEPWLMKIHGGAAMLTIYLAGTMLYGHMVNAWQGRRNRGSGGTAAATMLVLALTGYGLYYFGGERASTRNRMAALGLRLRRAAAALVAHPPGPALDRRRSTQRMSTPREIPVQA